MGWQDVHAEALRRIRTREWAPGGLIPNEVDLAAEFGCARATVNRALRSLADEGWIERRRKAGTRVALAPQRRARLLIPLIRDQIAALGADPSHRILSHRAGIPPGEIRDRLAPGGSAEMWSTRTLYSADGRPFALEDRWVNIAAAPGYDHADLAATDPNNWLVLNAPLTGGTLDYRADPAGAQDALDLACAPGDPLLVLERVTETLGTGITHVTLRHRPGHRVRLTL